MEQPLRHSVNPVFRRSVNEPRPASLPPAFRGREARVF